MTKNELKLAKLNGTLDELYAEEVIRRIRERYPLNDELARLRQRDEKPEEFAVYNAFVEECKRQARKDIYGDNNAWI